LDQQKRGSFLATQLFVKRIAPQAQTSVKADDHGRFSRLWRPMQIDAALLRAATTPT
jgi:hypothetical protein